MSKLSKRQQLFVEEYLKDRHGTNAAIRAGYSPETACVQASRLLRNVYISQRVNQHMEKAVEKTEISQERILKELGKGAFSELDVSLMKYSDKLKALELLAKSLGMLDGKMNASGKDKETVTKRLFSAIDTLAEKIGVGGDQ